MLIGLHRRCNHYKFSKLSICTTPDTRGISEHIKHKTVGQSLFWSRDILWTFPFTTNNDHDAETDGLKTGLDKGGNILINLLEIFV